MSTILVVGATGNIGVSAITAALRNKYKVLAIVRNQDSEEKLFKHVGTKEGITTTEADVLSETGVQGVVEKVKKGELPAFQHVYSCVGRWMPPKLHEISPADYHAVMDTNVGANFFAYRATIPYLLAQNHPDSTWTICTGAAGEYGVGGVTAMTQGALFSMMNTAATENEKTNIRVNEIYLVFRVDYDEVAEKSGSVKASEFGKSYEKVLTTQDLDGCRLHFSSPEDLEHIRYAKLRDYHPALTKA